VTTPCQSALSIASVTSTVGLAGVTKAAFNLNAARLAFKSAIAATAGVVPSVVSITTVKETTRRVVGVEVGTVITLVGDDQADLAAAIVVKLQDKAALQTNIQSKGAGTGLASATVASTTAVASDKTPAVSTTANNANSAGNIAAHALLLVLVACFHCALLGLAQT